MPQVKRPYETTFIVNASLEDLQIDAVINHVQEIITRHGGEIIALNKWGRKRLAYTIKKKNNGFYVNIEFSAIGTVISQLERAFLLDENILRFLTIQQERRGPAVVTVPAEAVEQAAPVRTPIFTDDGSERKA
jgi:small subunit ribosomal protein S6